MASTADPDLPPEAEQGPPKTVETDDIPLDTTFSGPFFQAIDRRKADGRDAKVLVTAKHAQTGVGKSNLCDFCGYVCDTTEDGFSKKKVTIKPAAFFESYGRLEQGSALVLEEGEQLDPRRAMQKENVEASHTWQMERVREIIAFINLPSPKFIDNRMEELADFWINVHRRGRARVYKKKIHDFKGVVYYETMQDIEWPNMDGSDTFREMAALKEARISGEESSSWVPPDEHEAALEKREKEVRTEMRDAFLKAMYNWTQLTAPEIAQLEPVTVSASRVRQIANEST